MLYEPTDCKSGAELMDAITFRYSALLDADVQHMIRVNNPKSRMAVGLPYGDNGACIWPWPL